MRTGAKDQRPRCDTRVHAPALCTSTERQRDDLRRPLVFENRRLLLPAMKSALCGSARCGAKRCAPPRRARHAAAEGVPQDAECFICRSSIEGKGIVRGCACRGTMGLAHVACLVRQAEMEVKREEEWKNMVADRELP